MKLHTLGKRQKIGYTTWGCIWEKGEVTKGQDFVLENADGSRVPVQSRITAYWADGSAKWTAHTADAAKLTDEITVSVAKACETVSGITVEEKADAFEIHAGKARLVAKKSGKSLFDGFFWDGKTVLESAVPVLLLEQPVSISESQKNSGVQNISQVKEYLGHIESLKVEENGPLQAVLCFRGIHESLDGEARFPFVIRVKVGYDSERLDVEHTFLYDGDENRDFLKGIGIRYESPLSGAVYNRHIKIQGDHGTFHEMSAELLSWRPRVPEAIYHAQNLGEAIHPTGEDQAIVEKVLKDMPFWDHYEFVQDSASHFSIKKGTGQENCCLIDCLHGNRSNGGLSFGSENGSVLLAIRDFWEKYPAGFSIQGLTGERAQATAWFWSPSAQAMDFRHYANRGYNQVYYEGYDYKGADPVGIACTSQMAIQAAGGVIPADEELIGFADSVKHPVQYVGSPEFYHKMRAFGYWSLPSKENETQKWLEDQLDQAIDFYKGEVEQRNWYGLFNYGDFMHTYDKERHQWRYDMGGYAWDNTELVPTLWLWYEFLRSGREDVFVLAEKLSRHASEVDVYHMGRYKGLGSRHNVRHWGCPCKEARIAMAGHHRFYYYMTGDRRFEDIFEELKDNEMTFLNKDPLGDFYDKSKMTFPSHARSGPDWSSLCSNWMTQWERTNDPTYRDKILVGMQDIKNAPLRLISGPDFEFDPESVHLRYIGERTTGGTHLQICMGAPQIWAELADMLEDEEWKQMMAEYGRFYYLPKDKQQKESNGLVGEREFSLPFMAAAMGAYGAAYLKDEVLAKRTWAILLHCLIDAGSHAGFASTNLENVGNQKMLREIPWISTNFTAQWCLNVIVVLDWIRTSLPKTLAEADELVEPLGSTGFHKA